MLKKAVFICFNYDLYHLRNRRSFEVFDELKIKKEIYSQKIGKNLFKALKLIREINKRNQEKTLFYIHDSGIFGFIYCFYIKLLSKKNIVVLDYHDLVEWDIYYQINKIRIPKFLKYILTYFFVKVYKVIFIKNRYIDFLVYISERQKIHSETKYRIKISSVVIQNGRTEISCDKSLRSKTTIPGLVWIGNIRRGTDLESLLKLKQQLESSIQIKIFGKILDKQFAHELKQEGFILMGAFESDSDIESKLSNKDIAVFFGWNDRFNLGINHLASPNKIFSYFNLELPILIHSSLKNITDLNKINKFSYSFDNQKEFFRGIKIINDNYNAYSKGSSKIKKIYNDEILRKELKSFFKHELKL